MDAESLKIILDLKEDNVLLQRGIKDAIIMLARKKGHTCIEYDDKTGIVSALLRLIYDLYPSVERDENEKRDDFIDHLTLKIEEYQEACKQYAEERAKLRKLRDEETCRV